MDLVTYALSKKYTDDQMIGAGNVTGVKGDAEEHYRAGTVNLTPANIGSYAKSETYSNTETDTLLADKVDKVEGKGLSTNDYTDTDKELVGNIASMANDIDDLQEWTSASTKTVTGNPITINDGSALPAKSVSVTFEPKQDLHGYDKPWAGGAGKNKLRNTLTSQTVNAVVLTVYDDGSFKANGLSSNYAYVTLGTIALSANTLYKLSKCGQPYGAGYYLRVYGTGLDVSSYDTDVQFSVTSDITASVQFVFSANKNIDNAMIYPMVYLATETDPTFEPYSNVCPIEGYTDCEVEVTGNDVWTGNDTYTGSSAGYIIPNFTIALPVGTYSFEFDCVNANNGMQFEVFKDNSTVTVNRIYNSGGFTPKAHNVIKFTINEAGTNLRMWSSSTTNVTISNVRLYSTVSEYTIDLDGTRYGGKVDFNSGVMRVDCIKNTVLWGDGQSETVLGDNTRKYFSVSQNTGLIGGRPEKYTCNVCQYTPSHVYDDDSTGFYIASNGNRAYIYLPKDTQSDLSIEFTYELATPFTVQLTPEQIRTLEGTNNISTNMTDMSLEYLPSTLLSVAEIESRKYTDEKIAMVLPTAPSTDGTYVLTCTVDGGEASLSWVEQN